MTFWNILLRYFLISSGVILVIDTLFIIKLCMELDLPERVRENMKKKKATFVGMACAFISLIFLATLPVIRYIFTLSMVLDNEAFTEQVYDSIVEKYC